jgi:hypothetical protein
VAREKGFSGPGSGFAFLAREVPERNFELDRIFRPRGTCSVFTPPSNVYNHACDDVWLGCECVLRYQIRKKHGSRPRLANSSNSSAKNVYLRYRYENVLIMRSLGTLSSGDGKAEETCTLFQCNQPCHFLSAKSFLTKPAPFSYSSP